MIVEIEELVKFIQKLHKIVNHKKTTILSIRMKTRNKFKIYLLTIRERYLKLHDNLIKKRQASTYSRNLIKWFR